MQDVFYDEYAEDDSPKGFRRILSLVSRWGGAVLSIAVLLSFVVWAYRLGQRDASDIPVIKALDGPIRERPLDPGGTVVGNQGLEVNEILAGNGAQTPAETTLAPATLALSEEDTPVSAAQDAPEELTAEEIPGVFDPLANEAGPEIESDDPVDAPVEAEAAPSVESLIADALDQDPGESDAIPEGEEEVLAALRPRTRPRNFTPPPLSSGPPEDVDEVAAPAAPQDNPENLPAGTRLVQLGAFDSPSLAQAQWRELSGEHADLLGSKRQYVQEAVSNGRTFYRLRVIGFDDRNAQSAMCEALRARAVDCIPVTVR